MDPRPRLGVSRCLLGDKVRYDGGHKADPFILQSLGAHVEWVPVCPEVEVGMGTPRESVHLLSDPDGVPAAEERVRLVGVRSAADWTHRMAEWAHRRTRALEKERLAGFVFKKDSPSCGLERVRVHHPRKAVTRTGRGLFAHAFTDAQPDLPVEEEGRLHDPRLRENFIERVFAFTRVRALFEGRWTHGALVAFHTAHKLQLLAHSRVRYTELGRLVADGARMDRQTLATQYRRTFMAGLSVMATPGKHADVMLHMLGHLKARVTDADRAELLRLVEDYRRGILPLVVPLTVFQHHVRVHEVAYLRGQTYLEPHPRELALRNHV